MPFISQDRLNDYSRTRAIEIQYEIDGLQEKLKNTPTESPRYSSIQKRINKLQDLQREICPSYVPHCNYYEDGAILKFINRVLNFILLGGICIFALMFICAIIFC